jgi:hypothetical protein
MLPCGFDKARDRVVVLGRKELSAILLGFAAIAVYMVLLAATPSLAQNNLNCSDFPSQAAAQANLRANPSDPNGLDGPPGPTSEGIPGVACENFSYPPGSPTDFNPVNLTTNQDTILTGVTQQNPSNQGGVTAIAGSSRQPPREKSIINIPKKPLPPSGGFPVYGVVASSVLAGAGLLALGLLIHRGSRRGD